MSKAELHKCGHSIEERHIGNMGNALHGTLFSTIKPLADQRNRTKGEKIEEEGNVKPWGAFALVEFTVKPFLTTVSQ